MPATGLRCLVSVAGHHGIELSVERLTEQYRTGEREISHRFLRRIAREHGLVPRTERLSFDDLLESHTLMPLVGRLRNGFFVTLLEIRPAGDGRDDAEVVLFDPLAESGQRLILSRRQFMGQWDGSVLFLRARAEGQDDAGFTFSWFFKRLLEQPVAFGEVVVATLLIHLLAFTAPLFTMVVLDRVIATRSLDTLHVLFIGAVVAILFHAFLSGLRSLLLLHAVGRIDVQLADMSFGRLLGLPLAFFHRNSAGNLTKHMAQAQVVREFVTGAFLMTLLEALAIFIFLPVLLLFSVPLTIVVLSAAVIIGINLLIVLGPYRRRLQQLYINEGDRQAMLVETMSGMETVKSLALERVQHRRWLDRSAKQINLQYRIGAINNVSSEISQFVQKLMGLVLIWLGVMFVLDGTLTVGALIAFNMLSMRVCGPLVQLVQLVSKMEQMGLSLKMLAGVMRQPGERRQNNGATPMIQGAVRFDEVSFRYGPEQAIALDRLSIDIPAGSAVGVVGRSGSGKSTLTRLIQGLYTPIGGVLRIDGVDLRELNLPHLRSQIGVVPQQTYLFKGTIRENIALGHEGVDPNLVLEAARLAGVHEFAEGLPLGYDTMLEEAAANLSVGQRQRIALARALVRRPAVLILDEATSALDPETEANILRHFDEIAAGRTVIVVSHRLATLTHLDAIIVLERGRLVDIGPHGDLMERCAIYQALWAAQTAPISQRQRRLAAE